MILHSSAQLIFGETTATVQTTSRVSGDVKVVGRRLCERERGIGGGGTSQVSRVTCRPAGRWGPAVPTGGHVASLASWAARTVPELGREP